MDPLPENATLCDVQGYVAKLEVERGFQTRPAGAQCLKLVAEIGELAEAVGVLEGQPQNTQRRTADVGEESADVALMLISVVNRFDVDLEDAIRCKEERNNHRVWRRSANTTLRALQHHVAGLEAERGLDARPAGAQCLKLVAHVGKLADVVGVLEGQPQNTQRRTADVGEESADVALMLISVVNRFDVDLEDAIRCKEERNNHRVWKQRSTTHHRRRIDPDLAPRPGA